MDLRKAARELGRRGGRATARKLAPCERKISSFKAIHSKHLRRDRELQQILVAALEALR